MQGTKIIVTGKVQGVFFRQSAKEEADRLGLTGWVRNVPDGSVEIAAFGDEKSISQLIEWCQEGPPVASVVDLQLESIEFEEHDGFNIK